MTVNCCRCGRYVGQIEGKLLKGWAMLCPDCNEWSDNHDSRDAGTVSADVPEFLKKILRGGSKSPIDKQRGLI